MTNRFFCNRCQTHKPFVDFYDSTLAECKSCKRARSNSHYQKNRERLAAASLKRYHSKLTKSK